MMVRIVSYSLIIALLTASSCNTTKRIPDNDALYLGATVKVESDSLANKKKGAIRTQLKALTRPKPNRRIFGIPLKLYFYNMGGFFRKWGEPPVLLSSLNLENNIKILQNTLENTGYFQAIVTGDTSVKNKKARAIYTARPGAQYTINTVTFERDSSDLQKAINRTKPRSLLKTGQPFDLAVIKAERTRIDASLKNRGFYYFAPEYLMIDTDSTIGNKKVNLYVNTKRETPREARKVYSINRVYIYSNYSLNDAQSDTNSSHAKLFRGYYVVDSSKFYKPRLFAQAMQFNPGDIYNRREHNVTLNRLINLGIFKFVKNRFEPAGDTSLDVYYYLTPLPKKSLRAELGGLSKTNNVIGTQISVGFTNRNTFRGGEILTIDTYVGSEIQYSGQSSVNNNAFRLGAEANLAFPRFITPFFTINPKGGFVPRTNMQLGYDILVRPRYYTLNSSRIALGYIWKESIQKEHTLYPISIQYVQPSNITQEYLDSLKDNPTLAKAIDTQFIVGGTYNYNYNSLVRGRQGNGIYFNGLIDLSGNIAGIFTKGSVKKGGEEGRIFGAPFSQYIKGETDFRVYRKIGTSNIWANRIIIGVGMPHGNSRELPFIKQFFVGGNNSLRAFRSRSVGPGTYLPPNVGDSSYIPDQSGDIKLELNSELRFKLINMIYGALFVDAGNIWLWNENPDKPGAKFSKDFLSELAVGAGVGIRVDINILVLRLDVGFPLKKPYLAEKNRWLINEIDVLNPGWRKDNLIFNLAIGYPF